MIGKVLNGRYEILEEIGKGGMAYVYKARCVLLNRLVAIKILRDDLDGDKEFLDRFNAEAQAAASLDHPNIVAIFDVGLDDNRHYITMEYIDGITLKEYIARKRSLDYEEALNIAWQISDALSAAHNKNIVHRDIKPHNILITSDGTVKVTDFGIARFGTSKTLSSGKDILGSVHYISPEQAKGIPVDNRSDIYSLGVVMYEMLSGRVPFDGDNPVSVAMMQIENSPVDIVRYAPNIPVSSQNIVLKAMSKDPDLRYQNADDLKDDIAKVLRDPYVIIDKRFLYDNLNPEPETQSVTYVHEDFVTKTSVKVMVIILAAITAFVIVMGGYFLMGVINKNSDKTSREVIDYNHRSKESSPNDRATVSDGGNINNDKEDSTFELKDYVGQNYEVVQKRLNKLDLRVDIKFEENPNIDDGEIIRHIPESGAVVKPGDVIILYVSKPEEEAIKPIEVPYLVGMTYSQAKDKISATKLKFGGFSGVNNPSPDDIVISQSIPAGDKVAEQCTISITLESVNNTPDSNDDVISATPSKQDESEDIVTTESSVNDSIQSPDNGNVEVGENVSDNNEIIDTDIEVTTNE